MSKLLPALLVLALFLAGFPLFALLAIVSMSAQAAAACQPAHVVSATLTTGVDGEVVGLLMKLRFGPGYPRAWQGPPPGPTTTGTVRASGVAAQVPLLATGANIVAATDGAPVGATATWRLELPDGRAFGLTV